jgi:hypothetical protein
VATSTKYGWTEPDDTDYVKNGALAMRTLGNAIDTTVDSIATYKVQILHPLLLMGA